MLSDKTIKKFQGIRKCSINGHKVKDLFQMVLNAPDLWQQAYGNIYANKGGMTPGVDGLTIDGYSEERAATLRELLRENRYVPTPVRRVYIPKPNGKQRPLGIPNPNDKQVQEVWRMTLESIYEPVFKESSHGFRMQRSCHTALKHIDRTWQGIKWFIEFDIEGYLDNIDHKILMELLEKKIDDVKFLNVIRKMLKAGYMEDWRYHKTYSGTPQGGIISPILANIYLHELDSYAEQLISDFTQGKERRVNTEYDNISQRIGRLNKHISKENDPTIRKSLIERKRELQRRLLEIPSGNQHDEQYRRLKYCRYADDFLLGVIGTKAEAEDISRKIETFLRENLKLTISASKSGIKHHTEIVRFLGYDITIKHDEKVVKLHLKGQHIKRRTSKGQLTLLIPEAKLKSFAEAHGYGSWERMKAEHRASMAHQSDAEIALRYSDEMRGIAQYYALAKNYSRGIGRLRFLGVQSLLMTMSNKHQTSMQKVATMLNRGSYLAVRETGKGGKVREYKLFRPKDVKRESVHNAQVDKPPLRFRYAHGSELLKRIDATTCEYCGKGQGYLEVHHIRKLADMKEGKQPWQRFMIARKRKTLVLCIECHDRLHAGTLPDRRHFQK